MIVGVIYVKIIWGISLYFNSLYLWINIYQEIIIFSILSGIFRWLLYQI